ncbi:MAG: hypothetical protein JXA95_01615 [Spirochaetales bacterium]|nr:hypothetical protein [Spirochaetales bacterium]
MRLPIINIGNSRGIRIPQAILKQVSFKEETELEVVDGKIVLSRLSGPEIVPDFTSLSQMNDATIQRMLRKISGTDLITALIDADRETKEAVYRNLSERVKNYIIPKVEKLEQGDIRDLFIERSRILISEAFMEVLNE